MKKLKREISATIYRRGRHWTIFPYFTCLAFYPLVLGDFFFSGVAECDIIMSMDEKNTCGHSNC